jgi:hypothetical protein
LGNLWAVNTGEDGYNNKYKMNMDGLNILNLGENDILLWMAILLNYRIPNNIDDDIEFIRKHPQYNPFQKYKIHCDYLLQMEHYLMMLWILQHPR